MIDCEYEWACPIGVLDSRLCACPLVSIWVLHPLILSVLHSFLVLLFLAVLNVGFFTFFQKKTYFSLSPTGFGVLRVKILFQDQRET